MAERSEPAPVRSFSPPPLTGGRLVAASIAISLANFMVVLDTTIANVSVPSIAGALAVSPSEGAWVITSYAVADAISVPLTGWLANRFGTVRVIAVAMLSFGVLSALCGLATSLPMLVMFRVLQGFSGGPMMPLSQTLLRQIFPPAKQGAALGIWSMTTVVAPIVGPILGGVICDNWGWEWIFYINVPIALAVASVVWSTTRSQETPTQKVHVDAAGLALLILWVGSLQIMLDKGKELGWFGSSTILALLCVAIVGFVVFVIWELTEKSPIVNLRIFSSRTFAIGALTISVSFGAFFSSIVLLPLWLQTNMGYTATWAGLAAAGNGVFAVIMSPLVGIVFLPRFDPRSLVSFGLVILAASAAIRSQFSHESTFFFILLPQLVQGFAMPFFFVPLTALTLSELKGPDIAAGAGLMNFARTTAAAFATSIVTTTWADKASAVRTELTQRVNPYDSAGTSAFDALVQAGSSPELARAQLDRLVDSQAVMVATDQVFLATAVLFLFGAVAIWATRPQRLSGPVSGH